jgi:hypothetical protein
VPLPENHPDFCIVKNPQVFAAKQQCLSGFPLSAQLFANPWSLNVFLVVTLLRVHCAGKLC